MEFTLLATAVVAVGALVAALRVTAGGYPKAMRRTWLDAALAAMGAGVLLGRLAAMIGTGTNPLTHPGDILIVRGGVSTGFAAAAALVVWVLSVRPDVRGASDAIAPAALFALAGWHGACLIRDSCAGTVSDLPWAITLPGSAVGRHPVELYAALAFAAAAVALTTLPQGSGVRGAVGLAAAGAIRLATEPLRLSLTGGPILWYTIGIGIGLGAAVAATRRRGSVRAVPD